MTVVSGRAASATELKWAVSGLEVETPSWGYGNSGTRFKVFPQPGVPRDPFEKTEDAATVGHYTGVARAIALHIPWDRVDDFSALAAFARERGVKIGGINSNTFQVQDWGQSLSVCRQVGERAQVCVDTGHHAMGTNIEQIVAILLQEGRLGGFDLNDKKYGDDDLMVGSIDPYQLFRICHELVKANADESDRTARSCASEVVYMLDQCHNIEPKMPAVIRSVMNLQEAFAKALLVDLPALRQAQESGDVLEANGLLKDAYDTDVRGLLARARAEAGLPEDPYRAYLASGEQRQREETRVGGVGAGWQ